MANMEEPPLVTVNPAGPTPTMAPTVSILAPLDTMETQHLNNVSHVLVAVQLAHQILFAQVVPPDTTSTH